MNAHMAIRWNIEADGNALRVCKGNHHRSADCEWERYVRETPARPDRALVEAAVQVTLDATTFEDRENAADALLALIFPEE